MKVSQILQSFFIEPFQLKNLYSLSFSHGCFLYRVQNGKTVFLPCPKKKFYLGPNPALIQPSVLMDICLEEQGWKRAGPMLVEEKKGCLMPETFWFHSLSTEIDEN